MRRLVLAVMAAGILGAGVVVRRRRLRSSPPRRPRRTRYPAAEAAALRAPRCGRSSSPQPHGPRRSCRRWPRRAYGRGRLPREPRLERAGQSGLPEPHRPRSRRPWRGAERDGGRAGSERRARTRRLGERLPPRGQQLLTYYSSDGGRSWRDSTPPTSFTRGDAFGGLPRKYWQAARRPDGGVGHARQRLPDLPVLRPRRRASRRTPTSRAPSTCSARPARAARRGTSPAVRSPSSATRRPSGAVFLDKELMAIDDHRRSPFRDRIYVSWTRFDERRHRVHLPRVLARLRRDVQLPAAREPRQRAVRNAVGVPTPLGACNIEPVLTAVHRPGRHALRGLGQLQRDRAGRAAREGEGGARLPGEDNRAQMLLARSTDGGNTFSAPVKVGDFYDLPDCETYQDGNGGGAAACPRRARRRTRSSAPPTTRPAAVDPRDDDEVVVTLRLVHQPALEGEQRLRAARATTRTRSLPLYAGVKTRGACNNDIVVSRSTERRPQLHRRLDRRAPAARGARRRPARRPVLAVGGVRPQRAARRVLLRPRIRQRRA